MAVVVVTGCSRGLGLALVKHLAATSSVGTVVATARSQSPSGGLNDAISQSNGRISFVQLDVDDPSSIASAVQKIEHHIKGKGVDVLINNAGTQVHEPGGATAMHGLEETLHTNVVGVHKVSSTFIPLMKKGSQKKLVNITSTLGSIGMSEVFAFAPVASYKVSKAALNMVTAQYALDLGKEGFTVFALSPGHLKTDLGGDGAYLLPEDGAKAVWEVVENATAKDNGAFRNIYIPGDPIYDGSNPPW